MNTYFAPQEKADIQELATEIEIVSKSPILSGLLDSINGLLCILNEHRQIVALNNSFIKVLGIDDPAEILGLRPGKAVKCVHAEIEPEDCGSTKYCSSCGAAIAIVSSMEQNQPVEKICALSINRDDKVVDVVFLVKSHPITIDGGRFLLLFLQDITLQEQRAALERTFFHDVNNMLYMLLGSSELLVQEEPSELAKNIHQASIRLHNEITIQRCLSLSETNSYQLVKQKVTTEKIFADIEAFFLNHPVADKKQIEFQNDFKDVKLNTDVSLLSRVLCNMTTNALEATEENGRIKIWVEQEGDQLIVCVWNAQEIPPQIVNRIFQRNFSSKEQSGRGIGTFSMRLFGEKVLGGEISFTTSKTEGTIFKFYHPL